MKNISISILVILTLAACSKNVNKEKDTVPSSESMDILSESGLLDYYHNTSGRTWKDLDAFYLSKVETYKDHPFIHNFKGPAISCLIKVYNLLQDTSEEATQRIGFYAEEMANLKNCNPELLYPCLLRLKGHWEQTRIAEVALTGYNNALSLFGAMKKGSQVYEERQTGIQNLRSLFEARQ